MRPTDISSRTAQRASLSSRLRSMKTWPLVMACQQVGTCLGELLLVVSLDPAAMAGVAERGRVALAHELGAHFLDSQHRVLVADLLAQEPAVEAKLVGILVVAELHVAGVDRQAQEVHRLVHGVLLALAPARFTHESIQASCVTLGRAEPHTSSSTLEP